MRNPVVTLMVLAVRGYQVALSPWFRGCCRFEPSCSHYAIEAFEVHGAVKGFLLAAWRLLRCHPFGKSGYDPVPPKGRWKNDFENQVSNAASRESKVESAHP